MMINRAPPYRLSYNHPAWLELWEYFGADFKPEWCGGGDQKIMDEFARYPDAATFYRQTPVYCYHGPGYALEAVKRPYYAIFLQGASGDVSVLDYGCGAGDDGLLFIQMGYEVAFADFPSQSVNFRCTDAVQCCPQQQISPGCKVAIDDRMLLVEQDGVMQVSFRCTYEQNIYLCSAYFGGEPAQLEITDVRLPKEIETGKDRPVLMLKVRNTGKRVRLPVPPRRDFVALSY